MITMRTSIKVLAASLVALFITTGCGDESANPTGGGANEIWISNSVDGKCVVPMTASDPWFTVTAANTYQLQFGAAGRTTGGVLSIASIIFPLAATSGTYNVVPTRPVIGGTMAAGTVYVEMGTNNLGKKIAQSGTVTFTASGDKYTIDYTDLPALSDATPPVSSTLSAHLAN
jgi:hypothetical protein